MRLGGWGSGVLGGRHHVWNDGRFKRSSLLAAPRLLHVSAFGSSSRRAVTGQTQGVTGTPPGPPGGQCDWQRSVSSTLFCFYKRGHKSVGSCCAQISAAGLSFPAKVSPRS